MGAHKAEVTLSDAYYMEVGGLPDPNDPLAIPAFLDRRKFEVDKEDGTVYAVLSRATMAAFTDSGPRVWAPMRSPAERYRDEFLRKMREEQNVWVDNKADPVQVVTTKRENLQLYANFDDFMKMHDFEDYPVKKVMCAAGMSYIQVKAPVALTGLSEELKDMDRPKVETIEQNGVKRPKANSVTGIAWAQFDAMLKEGTDFKTVVFPKLQENGMNPSTIRTQYAHWRKFNGISK